MKDIHPRLVRRLINWRYGTTPNSLLNDGPPPKASGLRLDVEIKQHMNGLKGSAFNIETGMVDYTTLSGSEAHRQLCLCTRHLQTFDPASLNSHEERLAFWINIYNSMVIDGVIACNVKQSVREIRGFFWRAAYNINGYRFNAFDIEYGILRADGRHPAIPGPQFSRSDPRRHYSMRQLDPRIHFALVCASSSCPPIAVYDAERIDEQLDLAARAFVNGGGVQVDAAQRQVNLSLIFKWYAQDFGAAPFAVGNRKPLLEYVAPYMQDEWLRAALADGQPLKVRFQKYDWALNTAGLSA